MSHARLPAAYRLWPLAILLLSFLLMAHTQPIKLEPAPGATLRQAPAEIRLTFPEPVGPNPSIILTPPNSFTPLPGINTQQDPAQPGQIFATLPPLAAGTYNVQWQVQSSDGHSLTGTYSFTTGVGATFFSWPFLLFVGALLLLGYWFVQKGNLLHRKKGLAENGIGNR
jgi:methionine-rich copper-binding protein CopC